jgi:hypothetical protein
MKNIKNYFIRLWRAIWNLKDVQVIELEVVKEVIEPKSKNETHLEKMEHLSHLNADRIREIIDMTIVNTRDDDHNVQELINNRKAINEYKDWYVRLVGYNPPPEELKKLIDADHKLDRTLMNRLLTEMYEEDIERFKKIDERAAKNKPSPFNQSMDIDSLFSLESPSVRGAKDLRKILMKGKESGVWKRLEEDVVEKPEWKPATNKIPQGILDKVDRNEINKIETVKSLK